MYHEHLYKQLYTNIKSWDHTDTAWFRKDEQITLQGWTTFGPKGSNEHQDNNKGAVKGAGCIKVWTSIIKRDLRCCEKEKAPNLRDKKNPSEVCRWSPPESSRVRWSKNRTDDQFYVGGGKGEALKRSGGSTELWVSFCPRASKITGVMKKEDYPEMLKQHLNTSARTLQLGCNSTTSNKSRDQNRSWNRSVSQLFFFDTIHEPNQLNTGNV